MDSVVGFTCTCTLAFEFGVVKPDGGVIVKVVPPGLTAVNVAARVSFGPLKVTGELIVPTFVLELFRVTGTDKPARTC